MGKLGDKDWWLGKTEDQQRKRAEAKDQLKKEVSQFAIKPAAAKSGAKGERLAKGVVDNYTAVSIYNDGTFTYTKGIAGLGAESARDRLISFDHETDSMRRKSVTGRGAAALATGGISLIAANNRGVVYVTVTGETTGVQTFTTRNPNGTLLSSLRTLKAAADSVIAQHSSPAPTAATPDAVDQLKKLAELHAAGVLTDDEFAAKKKDLLDRM